MDRVIGCVGFCKNYRFKAAQFHAYKPLAPASCTDGRRLMAADLYVFTVPLEAADTLVRLEVKCMCACVFRIVWSVVAVPTATAAANACNRCLIHTRGHMHNIDVHVRVHR